MKRRHFNHFNIAGFTYYEGPVVFDQLKIGTQLSLRQEEDNRYDAHAVAVYLGDNKLGFVPRTENNAISKLLECGYPNLFEVYIQKIDERENPENQVHVIVYLKHFELEVESEKENVA